MFEYCFLIQLTVLKVTMATKQQMKSWNYISDQTVLDQLVNFELP